MIKRIIMRMFPRGLLATLRNYWILSVELGQLRAMRRLSSVDATGAPIPWYTYPAIEYLKQLDFSGSRVFEYGSGNSTAFWANRCGSLTAVEDDVEWFCKTADIIPVGVDYCFRKTKDAYVRSIRDRANEFDIIIIDGSHRYDCAVEALAKLKDTGFIILDNSDWHEKTSELLRSAGLIEVDMSGFGPINGYTWTTSFYFRRNVKLYPAADRQPVHGIGSLPHTEIPPPAPSDMKEVVTWADIEKDRDEHAKTLGYASWAALVEAVNDGRVRPPAAREVSA